MTCLLLALLLAAAPGKETSSPDIPRERARLETAIRAEPDNVALRVELAKLLASVGDPDARRSFEEAIRRSPSDPGLRSEFADYLWSVGDAEAADAQISRVLALAKPKPGFRKFYGLKLFDQGNFKLAAAELAVAAREAPGDADVLYALGCAELENGRFSEAESALRRAEEIAPRRAATHGVLGKVHLLQGQSATAADELSRAVELDPVSAAFWLDLGNARSQTGDFPGAETSYRRAVELAPKSPAPRSALASLLARLKRPGEAAREADTARELYARAEIETEAARSSTAKLQSARVALGSGRWSAAEAAYREMPETVETLRGLAEALSGQNRHREAAQVLSRALALAPEDARLSYALAREQAKAE